MYVVHTYNGILTIRRNAFESVGERWMNLKPIIWGGVSQKEKNKYSILKLSIYIYIYVYGIWKNGTDLQT